MSSTVSVGRFATITHLSVKTLRHYQQVGLLEPAQIDPSTGYRYYTLDQLPTATDKAATRSAHAGRRRACGPNRQQPQGRDTLIAAYIDHLETELAKHDCH